MLLLLSFNFLLPLISSFLVLCSNPAYLVVLTISEARIFMTRLGDVGAIGIGPLAFPVLVVLYYFFKSFSLNVGQLACGFVDSSIARMLHDRLIYFINSFVLLDCDSTEFLEEKVQLVRVDEGLSITLEAELGLTVV